ncbi:hypothetical protein CLOM_g20125 [Closterium sp. NIES-68]|nr:hypothetical protein CLOM_g20125 [Closterium sp. NIES-68]
MQSASPPLFAPCACRVSAGVAVAFCGLAASPPALSARSRCSRIALGAARRSLLHAGRGDVRAWGGVNSSTPLHARRGDGGRALSGGKQRSHWRWDAGNSAEEGERGREGEEEEEEEGVAMVIIGAGRIGQAFMQIAPPNSTLFLPRGMPLSSLVQLSPRHSQGPIVVATHNCHLDDVLAQVPPERHSDLVLVQNGMLDGWLAAHGLTHSITRVLLYMAAAGEGGGAAAAAAADDDDDGRKDAEDAQLTPGRPQHGEQQKQQESAEDEREHVHCCHPQQLSDVGGRAAQPQMPAFFTSSPHYPLGVHITDGGGRSVASGRWAPFISHVLSASAVPCTPVAPHTFRNLAGEKLLWSTTFWLLCATRGGRPLGEVVAADRGALRALGREEEGGAEKWEEEGGEEGQYEGICDRLCAYSMSIPAVVPSMDMALAEFPWRNGWFMHRRPTPTHTQLLASLLLLYPHAREVILPYLPAGYTNGCEGEERGRQLCVD